MSARLSGTSADVKEDMRQRVERGARLLDEKAQAEDGLIPVYWRAVIDVLDLDVRSIYRCVLGQLAAYAQQPGVCCFAEMTQYLDLESVRETKPLGFATDDPDEYPALTLAWEQYLLGVHIGELRDVGLAP